MPPYLHRLLGMFLSMSLIKSPRGRRLTPKAEPPPRRDLNRDSETDRGYRYWRWRLGSTFISTKWRSDKCANDFAVCHGHPEKQVIASVIKT